jgi:hypothetical protein
MSTPPSPGFVAILLTIAARWGFRVLVKGRMSSDDIGTIVDNGVEQALLVIDAGPRLCDWSVAPFASVPQKLPGYRLTRETFDIIQGGQEGPDGSIMFKGQQYRIHATWDGAHHVAEAVPGESAAAI